MTIVVNGALMLMEGASTPPERAAQVIAAEASGEGFAAMIAVGEVIRKRGSFDGFTVTNKDLPAFFASESGRTRAESRLAWFLSKFGVLSGGATHFDNARRFGRPVWSKGMTLVARWGGVEFYRKHRKFDFMLGKVQI